MREMETVPTTLLLGGVCAIHCSIGSHCGAGWDMLPKWREAVCVWMLIVHIHMSMGMPCMELCVHQEYYMRAVMGGVCGVCVLVGG